MYEYFEGTVSARYATRLVLDVGGVGYDLAVPIGAHFGEGSKTRVWAHLVVREDAQLLYGFPDRDTRDLFRLLLSVRGVGPGVALALLSGLEVDALVAAIVAGDSAALTRVKGVGKKTAEQILLDLRDKAPSWQRASELAASADRILTPRDADDDLFKDAIQALQSIGYSAKDARKSVEKAIAKSDAKDLEVLVRAALQS